MKWFPAFDNDLAGGIKEGFAEGTADEGFFTFAGFAQMDAIVAIGAFAIDRLAAEIATNAMEKVRRLEWEDIDSVAVGTKPHKLTNRALVIG